MINGLVCRSDCFRLYLYSISRQTASEPHVFACPGRQRWAAGVRGGQRPLDAVRLDVLGQRVLQQSARTWSLQQRDALHPLDPAADLHPHVPERLTQTDGLTVIPGRSHTPAAPLPVPLSVLIAFRRQLLRVQRFKLVLQWLTSYLELLL